MFPPFLIAIVVTLVIVGVILAILNAAPATIMDPTVKAWIRLLILGLTAIWLIYVLVGGLSGVYPYPYPYRHP